MPNITFYIDEKNTGKDGKAPIKANVTLNYKNISKTVARANPKLWYRNQKNYIKGTPPRRKNNIEQYIVASRNPNLQTEHEEVNGILDDFKEDLSQYFYECQKESIDITTKLVRDYFIGKKATVDTKKDFFEAWDEYVTWGEINRDKKKNTTKGIKTTKKLLEKFEEETGYKITFENIDLELYEGLKLYVLDELGYSFNYFAGTVRRLKSFLNSEIAKKYYRGTEHKKFEVKEVTGTLVYLTNDELSRLYRHKFDEEKYAKVRDIFVFACLTGLRISDWKELNRANVSGDVLIRRIKKTGKDVELPLLPEAKAILKKYRHQHKLLPKISEQKFNLYIKEACKLAEIDTPVEIDPIRKNGIKKVYPKNQLIGSHVARKTFVTGMVKRGFEIQLIKEFATISDERTLKRYLHIDTDLKREKLKKFGKL